MRVFMKAFLGLLLTTIVVAAACSAERLISTGARITQVLVQPSAATIPIGGHVSAQATALDSTGHPVAGAPIAWSSSRATVATVGATGDVTGIAAGTATITASSGDQSANLSVTVTATPPAPVATVSVSLASSSVGVGQGTQATATLRDASGNVLTGRTVTWSSSNTAVATVNASGAVTAVAAGTASIRATSEGQTGSATLTVTAPPPAAVASVTVSPAPATVQVGQTVQLSAVTRDASGNVLTGRVITWSSSNTAQASVSGTGLVTGVAAGQPTITATSEGRSGQSVVTVTSGPPPTRVDTIFSETFESGTLANWEDGVDPNKHRVLNDPTLAHSGSRVLQVTYPQNDEGGWLTHWFMPGFDSAYVRYYVRFDSNWLGGTKLIAFYGSRINDQWSAFGRAGQCPNGTDFFATMVVAEASGNPGATRFYTYYPAMAREPDGVTCWGRFGAGSDTTYYPPLAMSRGSWHLVEFWVKLNTPGSNNFDQKFWIDGVLRGEWRNITIRNTTDLRINSFQLTFSTFPAPQTQRLYVDDILVTRQMPR